MKGQRSICDQNCYLYTFLSYLLTVLYKHVYENIADIDTTVIVTYRSNFWVQSSRSQQENNTEMFNY